MAQLYAVEYLFTKPFGKVIFTKTNNVVGTVTYTWHVYAIAYDNSKQWGCNKGPSVEAAKRFLELCKQ